MASSFLEQFYLNLDEGWLPAWLLFVSVVSTANSIQAYISPDYHSHLYIGSQSTNNQSPSNALASRTFGTWTFISSIVRAYAAYNIHNQVVYDMAIWTYGIAFTHFMSEVAVYGSAQLRGRMVLPLMFASGTLTWMAVQRSSYLNY